jgi:hypothetical protein
MISASSSAVKFCSFAITSGTTSDCRDSWKATVAHAVSDHSQIIKRRIVL